MGQECRPPRLGRLPLGDPQPRLQGHSHPETKPRADERALSPGSRDTPGDHHWPPLRGGLSKPETPLVGVEASQGPCCAHCKAIYSPAVQLPWPGASKGLGSQLPEGSFLEAEAIPPAALSLPGCRAPTTAPLGPTGLISSWRIQASLHCPPGQSVHFGKTSPSSR